MTIDDIAARHAELIAVASLSLVGFSPLVTVFEKPFGEYRWQGIAMYCTGAMGCIWNIWRVL